MTYKKGQRIRMIFMDDPRPISQGTEGTIDHIDDMGQIHVRWDNGRYLAVIPGMDEFEVI